MDIYKRIVLLLLSITFRVAIAELPKESIMTFRQNQKTAAYHSDHDYNHQDFQQPPTFKFPTTSEKTDTIDSVVHSIKSIVKTVAENITTTVTPTTTTTEMKTTTIPTSTIKITTPLIDLSDNTTTNGIIQQMNDTILSESTTSNILTQQANDTILTEMMNNTATAINNTIIDSDSGGDSITERILTSTESILNNSVTTTKRMDWMGDGDNYLNLTMVHNGANNNYEDNTYLYIILAVIVGVLIAMLLILSLIYISYKKRNLYTLQEQASGGTGPSNVSTGAVKEPNCESPLAIEIDQKACYKF